jgi:hypothetical protein
MNPMDHLTEHQTMKLESAPNEKLHEKLHEKPEGERRALVIVGTGAGNAERPVGCGGPDAGDRV